MSEEEQKKPMSEVLTAILSGESDENAPKNLNEAFASVVEYFDSFNAVLASGDEKEIEKALDEYQAIQSEMDILTNNLAKKHDISPEKVKELLTDEKYFEQEDWEVFQEGTEAVRDAVKETPKLLHDKGQLNKVAKNPPKKKKGGGKKKGKKAWMRS